MSPLMVNLDSAPIGSRPKFTIIVPTHNRPDSFAKCLGSLILLDYPEDQFEIIAVDDGSSPPAQASGVILLRQDNQGPAAARNLGAAHATGRYLVFTDDDCTPEPGWLKAFDEALCHSPNALFGGVTQNSATSNAPAVFNQHLVDAVVHLAMGSNLAFVPTNNLCLSAEAFHALNGFSTLFRAAAAEDREFCERWTQNGGEIVIAPGAIIWHSHPQSILAFWRMHVRYGKGARQLHQIRSSVGVSLNRFELARQVAATHPLQSLSLFVLSQLASARGFFEAELRQFVQYSAVYALLVLSLLVAIYILGGFTAEFGGSDEAAHLVSGIMIFQYLQSDLFSGISPLKFAQDYYDHYPKVAIGHWPPVFYILEAGWFLLAGLSRASVMIFAAAISALLGLLTVILSRSYNLSWFLAITAGLVTVLLPQTIVSTLELSSDPLTAVAALIATLVCQRWLRDLDLRWGINFAFLGALAVLVKGNAFPVFMLPALILFQPSRWRSLLHRNFLIPIVLLILLPLPWYFFSRELAVAEILPGTTTHLERRISSSSWSNARAQLHLVGPALLMLAALSFVPAWGKRWVIRWPVLAVMPIAFWFFLSYLSPHTEERLMLAHIPLFCFAAGLALHRIPTAAGCLLLILSYGAADLSRLNHPKRHSGFVPAVEWTLQHPPQTLLVASNDSGEGGWISEMALRQPKPFTKNIRATKLLQRSTWMGEDRVLLVQSALDVDKILKEKQIDVVVIHQNKKLSPLDYQALLIEALTSWPVAARFDEVEIRTRPLQR